MQIDLQRRPRYKDAPDEDCVWYLIVKGHTIGTYYGGENKFYEDKYKWAEKQIKKRALVLEKNIKRVEKELSLYKKELEDLKIYK